MIVCDICGKEYANRRFVSVQIPPFEDQDAKFLGSLYCDLCTNCDSIILKMLRALFKNKESFSITNYLKENSNVKKDS